MNIQKIDHIAIAVSDLEKSIPLYRDIFKLPYHGVQTLENQNVKVAFFTCGEVEIELVQGLGPDAAVNRFIEKQGEGLYHIALRVDDAAETMHYLSEKGLRLGSAEPSAGANDTKVGFIRRSSTGGVIVELVEHAE